MEGTSEGVCDPSEIVADSMVGWVEMVGSPISRVGWNDGRWDGESLGHALGIWLGIAKPGREEIAARSKVGSAEVDG